MPQPYRDDEVALRARLEQLQTAKRDLDGRMSEITELATRRVAIDDEIEAVESVLRRRSPRGWLERLEIASPCEQAWDRMSGGERVRYCERCQKNVYNLESIPRVDALELLRANGDDICLRMRRRSDGTVLTRGCPEVAPRRLGQWTLRLATAGAAVVAAGTLAGECVMPARLGKAKVMASKIGAEVVRQSAELHLADTPSGGAPPCPTTDDLVDARKLSATKTDDPWGSPYRIECSRQGEVHVYSNGKDREPNTADDIRDDISPAELRRIAELSR